MAQISNPFTKRLKQARSTYGISQKQLGIKIGIDEFSASARMNQYETGKHAPDYITVINIGKFLGVPVSYFFEPDDELAEMIITFSRLTKSQKKETIRFINEKLIK